MGSQIILRKKNQKSFQPTETAKVFEESQQMAMFMEEPFEIDIADKSDVLVSIYTQI